MKKASLSTNENNMGGRKQITEHMYNHHMALLNAKPTLNTRTTPKPHVNASKKTKTTPQYKHMLE